MTDEPIRDREDEAEAEPGDNDPDEEYASAGDDPLTDAAGES